MHHAANDGQLRRILLPKKRGIGLDDVKKLCDDCGHAAKMSRSDLPHSLSLRPPTVT